MEFGVQEGIFGINLLEESVVKIVKTRSKYEHVESTAFKKVPAFYKLGGREGLSLEVNQLGERSLQSETNQTVDPELELDSDEEDANREVDSIMAPRIFNTIDDLVKFNSERDVLFQAVLQKIRGSKQKSNTRSKKLKVGSVPNKELPDASDMFNTVGSTDGSIERVQSLWKDYLIECLSMVQIIRQTNS